MKLAQRLVAARKAKGLTQADLAKKLDVAVGTVAGWETGNPAHSHGIAKERVKEVAKVLGLDPMDLLA